MTSFIRPTAPRAGEILVECAQKITKNVAELICTSGLKQVEVMDDPKNPLLLNALADDNTASHEEALLRIYQRLRPGNPPAAGEGEGAVPREVLRHEPLPSRPCRPVPHQPEARAEHPRGGNDASRRRPHRGDQVPGQAAQTTSRTPKWTTSTTWATAGLRTIDELASDELRKGLFEAPAARCKSG